MQYEYVIASDTAQGTYVASLLHAAIDASALPDYVGQRPSETAGKFVCEFENELSTEDKTALDAVVAAHWPDKTAKIEAINVKTRALIAAGYAYNGGTFSLSTAAQNKLNDLGIKIALGQIISYPVEISELNETEYDIVDEATAKDIFEVASNRILTIVTVGTTLKNSCKAAADQTALDAVDDTRT